MCVHYRQRHLVETAHPTTATAAPLLLVLQDFLSNMASKGYACLGKCFHFDQATLEYLRRDTNTFNVIFNTDEHEDGGAPPPYRRQRATGRCQKEARITTTLMETVSTVFKSIFGEAQSEVSVGDVKVI